MGWFAGRAEIDLMDTGISDKVGRGYSIFEWDECEIDQLFLAILRDEEMIVDYIIYTRDLTTRMEAQQVEIKKETGIKTPASEHAFSGLANI